SPMLPLPSATTKPPTAATTAVHSSTVSTAIPIPNFKNISSLFLHLFLFLSQSRRRQFPSPLWMCPILALSSFPAEPCQVVWTDFLPHMLLAAVWSQRTEPTVVV